ncbi:ATP-dependent endonuclease [Methylophilus sp. 5]|uniref:ATP-dependent nuclease n=1 Tax=Methylophilus sp. 5 TaxID=1112274 RepID=UPI00048C6267|nr:AAA family ATPase [Methylophilus sp. 5]
MYLYRMSIEGFRKLEKLEIRFKKGLNLIVGPNNAGKTAIIDALRVLLSTGDEGALRVSDLDLHVKKDGSSETQATFSFVFRGLDAKEEADFVQALQPVYSAGVIVEYEALLAIRYTSVPTSSRLQVKRWAGLHEETPVSVEMLDDLRAVYLPPLRDPALGLKPGRASQIAKLIQCLVPPSSADVTQVEDALKKLDDELKKTNAIKGTREAITKRHSEMMGDVLSQPIDVSLSANDFKKVAARLGMLISSLEVEQNGLGFNNLIFMAIVLSELAMNKDAAYRALLVEEPEAHLHPQLQAVLLNYLKTVEIPSEGESAVQVFLTSHSPNFAALADLDSIGCVYHHNEVIEAFFPREIAFEKKKKEKLQRYLNVTRAELFFARRIILVEGAAELFLVDSLARRLGYDLKKHAVSIISTDGLNFDAFIPLFGKEQCKIRVAILSDSDETGFPAKGATPTLSANAKLLETKSDDYLKSFFSLKTFEYELGLEAENQATMLEALKEINPGIGKALETAVNGAAIADRPRILFEGMFDRGKGLTNIQKGAFSQSLAQTLSKDENKFIAPEYIKNAFEFICN